jgi:hypothetical protein
MKFLLCSVLCFLVVAPVPAAKDSSVAAAVRARLEKVQKDVKQGSESTAAARAAQALGAGRVHLALHLLEGAWLRPAAERFVREHRDVKSADEFQREWNRENALLPTRSPAGQRPLLLAALSAAAAARSRPTLAGSLPYATDIDLQDGLYYLGEAHALTDVARFYDSLPAAAAGTWPELRSIAPDIADLLRVVAAMHTGADQRSRASFIPISTSIRLASVLDEKSEYAGALLEFLLARYQASLLVTPVDAAAGARERLAAITVALDDGRDHSIAKLFIEMAAAHLSGDLPPGPRGAAAIADKVLPAYVAIIERERK